MAPILSTRTFALCIVVGWCFSLCHSFSSGLQSSILLRRQPPAGNTDTRRLTPKLYEGYVPDGLTPEEYSKIKNKEAARLKKMNFGAFGPRFLKVERPDGDWFLMRSLWTGGYDSNNRSGSRSFMSSSDNEGDNKIRSFFSKISSFFKRWGPAMFLAYLAIDVSVAMEVSLRASQLKPRQVLYNMIKVAIWARRQNMWLVWWKAQTAKLAITGVLTPFSQKWIDYCEKECGWSRKYTVLVSSTVLIGGSLAYSIVVALLAERIK